MPTVINTNGPISEETTKMRYITPVIQKRWGDVQKILMEYYFTDGCIAVDDNNSVHRGKQKFADYLLLYKDNIPLAIVEAKALDHSADEGYSQAVDYARILDIPFAYATNGDDLIERDMLLGVNKSLKMKDFPTMQSLWDRYIEEVSMSQDTVALYTFPYYVTSTGKRPRYYQRIAINRTIKAIAEGKKRVLIVMATGTGKTFTAFQIVHRFRETKVFKKILYLADRNVLVDQTIMKDFKPFGNAMEKISNRKINTSREIFLGLYQQLTDGEKDYYTQLPKDFFDIIIVDECHRGSVSPESNWHGILSYFTSAVQIGMTATPKEGGVAEAMRAVEEAQADCNVAFAERDMVKLEKCKKVLAKAQEDLGKAEKECNASYFGNPIYTYSLKQGIEDGFLAPFKVLSVELNIDSEGWRPPAGMRDANGKPVEDRVYTVEDFDRKIVVAERREMVAKRITEYLKTNDMRYAKTIVFCEDTQHCREMVRLLENENADLVKEDSRYIMEITANNDIGKAQLDNFIDPSSKYPVIAVTSRLMSTGVDAETCELIVLDRMIGSMTEFKQIIGRGTRIKEKYECDGKEKTKMFFTVMDFRKNYLKFNDPEFDGKPINVTSVSPNNPFPPRRTDGNKGGSHPVGEPSNGRKIVRVDGVEVTIIGESVQYYDADGKLVKEDGLSCVRNNILMECPTYEEFYEKWISTKDKTSLGRTLLLGFDYEDSFRKKYGYAVDVFDIIACIAYGVEISVSKQQRTMSPAVLSYLEMFDDETKEIMKLLLLAYVETNFNNLRDIRNIFLQSRFRKLGLTPLKAINNVFKGRDAYLKCIDELENKLYER